MNIIKKIIRLFKKQHQKIELFSVIDVKGYKFIVTQITINQNECFINAEHTKQFSDMF